MSRLRLTIGTRGSDLALWQARFVRDHLVREHGCDIAIKVIRTSGDRIDRIPFDKMEGKGFFTRELEEALLGREIDLAVHSLKDLMTTQPDGLMLGAVGFRADRRDMLLVRPDAYTGVGLIGVRTGAVIGTSSARRACQITWHDPTLQIRDLRGNVPTRISRLREGRYDAIVIAAAGVTRLRLTLDDLMVVPLDPEQFLPAPAQGILGMQVRTDDKLTRETVARLNSDDDAASAALERGLLARFDAGCSLPLGVYSEVDRNQYRLKAVLGSLSAGRWTGVETTEAVGNDIDQVIDRVFNNLRAPDARCA